MDDLYYHVIYQHILGQQCIKLDLVTYNEGDFNNQFAKSFKTIYIGKN